MRPWRTSRNQSAWDQEAEFQVEEHGAKKRQAQVTKDLECPL